MVSARALVETVSSRAAALELRKRIAGSSGWIRARSRKMGSIRYRAPASSWSNAQQNGCISRGCRAILQPGGCIMQTEEMTKIEKSVFIRAPRSRVWKALTDSSEFAQWFRVATKD